MEWAASAVTLIVFASAAVAIIVGLVALRERPDPLAVPLAVTMFAVAAWALPHAISLGFTSVDHVAFWHQLRYPGTVIAPVAYLVLTLTYAGYDHWLTPKTIVLLGAIPLVTLIAVWTNSYHGVFWQSLAVQRVDQVSVFVPEVGPWYWINLGYLYLVTLVSLVVLGTMTVRSGPLYRKQAGLLFIGGVVPFITNIAINFGIVPGPTIDFTTTAFTVSGVTFALALFHFDLLELHPIARDRLINDLDDGVITLGPHGHIRDYNPTAAQIFEHIAVDRAASAVLPAEAIRDDAEFTTTINGEERWFRTRITPLTDTRDQIIGRIIYLNDITRLIEREQRISVLNRVLRHNIRNQLTIVTGHLTILDDHVPEAYRDSVTTAQESTQRVIQLADKARRIERTINNRGTTTIVSAARIAKDVVTDATTQYPDAHITLNTTTNPHDDLRVAVVDETLFGLALTELIDNAITHNTHDEPRVIVDVKPVDDHIHISVTDNGPGLPESDHAVVHASTETPLEHANGLGLWLVKWTVSLSAGSLTFTDNDPHGCIATLTLPATP